MGVLNEKICKTVFLYTLEDLKPHLSYNCVKK